jgi:hypothetical protein
MRKTNSRSVIVAVLVAGAAAVPCAAADSPRAAMTATPLPGDFLGYDPCAEGSITDSRGALGYLRAVAAQCDRVRIETIGLSVEGRPIVAAMISSPENLKRLDEIRARRDRVVALVTCGVHPAEVGSTPSGLALLHRLVAGRSARAAEVLAQMVVIIIPCLNPDGTDRVADWLRSEKDARGPDGPPPFPQHRFTGHDLNRDWLLGTQPEVRAVIEQVHNEYRPWITIDLHEMVSNGPRVFIPPYAEPIDPAVSLDLLRQLELLGTKVLDGLTRSGRRGAVRRWTYDAWSPSRAYPLYHGGLRFLIEAASARYHRTIDVSESGVRVFDGGNVSTSDYPAPWRGGKWGLPEITDYLVAAAELALEAMLEEPLRSGQQSHWNTARVREAVRLDGGADPWAAAELRDALELGGVELRREKDGASWLAVDPSWGRGWCRSLLLCEPYPGGHAPYDTAAHDLAVLAGVRASLADPVPIGRDAPTRRAVATRGTRGTDPPPGADIQVLAGEGSASDEGWLRWTLEEHRFRFRRVQAEDLEIPERGRGPRGIIVAAEGTPCSSPACAEKLKAFAASGGRVILLGRAARDAARAARLPVEEAAVDPSILTGTLLATRWPADAATDPVLRGYASAPPVFHTGGPLWKPPSFPGARTVLSIDRDAPILCGALAASGAELGGTVPLLRVREGEEGGEWLLFGFSPCYRAWTLGTMRLLWNAIEAPRD